MAITIFINCLVILVSASRLMTVSANYNPFNNIRDDYNRQPNFPRFQGPSSNFRNEYNDLPNPPRFRRFRLPNININSNNDDNNEEYNNTTSYRAQNDDYQSINGNNNNNTNDSYGYGDNNNIYPNNRNNIQDQPNSNINHIKSEKCQPERLEHQVIMKRVNDSTGRWVIYSQIVETRNVGHHCHNNEFVYLAHRQKAGWLWNTTIKSLVHYSLGEPKFVTRPVRNPLNSNNQILVNLSRNYASATVDLDQIFPKRLATELVTVGADDLKWSELAKQFLPILKMNTAYLEIVKRTENGEAEQIKVLSETQTNREVLE